MKVIVSDAEIESDLRNSPSEETQRQAYLRGLREARNLTFVAYDIWEKQLDDKHSQLNIFFNLLNDLIDKQMESSK